MHIGNLRTALYAYLFARHNNGKFILRIEDTDAERFVADAGDIILRTMKQTGLRCDEGPGTGGAYGPYVQSERKEIYKKYADILIAKGGAYRCFCSRERLDSLTDGRGQRKYDKHCLSLSSGEAERRYLNGESCVVRQNIPPEGVSSYTDMVFGEIAVNHADMEDNILLKSDGMPTYNFANVVDDHLMEITHVIRGMEYLSSTPKYNLLYDSFGWRRPEYMHLPPIMRDANHKLSKRAGDPSYDDLIREGFLKDALLNYIVLLGWSPKSDREIFTFDELISLFSVEGIGKAPAIFDKRKLKWMNGEYIKAMPPEEFYRSALPYLENSAANGIADLKLLAGILHTRIEAHSDIAEKVKFLGEFGDFNTALYRRDKLKTDEAAAAKILPALTEAFGQAAPFTHEQIYAAFTAAAEKTGFKNGQVMWCGRIALTGSEVTPGGAVEMAEVLGKTESLRRLRYSQNRL
jgi:glutamyl-tRNA synthetase